MPTTSQSTRHRWSAVRTDRPTDFLSPADRYHIARARTESLCAPLLPEDYVVQSMVHTSPTKWHLAHTTWFYETFVLSSALSDYRAYHPRYRYLFNSYYNAVGEQFPRHHRGLLTRPSVGEIHDYRRRVDEHMRILFDVADESTALRYAPLIELGIQHEMQHQELILTDIKHAYATSPLDPTYRERTLDPPTNAASVRWHRFDRGMRRIGHGADTFAFDNEKPRHDVYVPAFELASRLVTNGEYRAFIEDGGYSKPEFWFSDGWHAVTRDDWQAPLYWRAEGEQWFVMTLAGLQPLNEAEPVCHVSYYEADAFARWSRARLPTEAEWEVAAETLPVAGNFAESERFHPAFAATAPDATAPSQMFGDVWEWTASPYIAYPGFSRPQDATGEYNAKFMCNQMVLRGGSCVTPRESFRKTYRNFFPPDARWQFAGFRLARDLT